MRRIQQSRLILFLAIFLSSPIGLFAARISGGGGSGSSGGGSGMTPGASYYVNVDAAPPLQTGAMNLSSGTVQNLNVTTGGSGASLNSYGTLTVDRPDVSAGFGAGRTSLSFDPSTGASPVILQSYDSGGTSGGWLFKNYNGDNVLFIKKSPQLTGLFSVQIASDAAVGLKNRYTIDPVTGIHNFDNTFGNIIFQFDPVKGSSTTLPSYFGSSVTFNGQFQDNTFSPGVSGQIWTSNGSGNAATWQTATSGGGGGGNPISLTTGTASAVAAYISSPTIGIVADQNVFKVTLITANTTFLGLNPASVTLQGQNVLSYSSANANFLNLSSANATYQLRNTIWPGGTFYAQVAAIPSSQAGAIFMASGTVTQFYASTTSIGLPIAPFVDNPLTVAGNTDDSLQVNIQNKSAGTGASSDLVLTSDVGSNTVGYVNLGINSSGYNQSSFSITKGSDSYLYAANNSLAIGIADTSPSYLRFFTGGTLLANERMHVSTEGIVMVNGNRFGINGTTPTWTMTGTSGQVLTTDGNTPPAYTFTTVGGGSVNIASGPVYASTNTTTVQNTTTEGSLIGYGYGASTIPAGGFYVGQTFLIAASGLFSDATVAPGTLIIRIRLAGVEIASTTAFTPVQNQTNSVWDLKMLVTIRSLGASGSLITNGSFVITDTLGITQDVYPMIRYGTVPINTTLAQGFDLTAQWGSTSGSNIINCTNFVLDSFNGNGSSGGSSSVSLPANSMYQNLYSSGSAIGADPNFLTFVSSVVVSKPIMTNVTGGAVAFSSMTGTGVSNVTLTDTNFTVNTATNINTQSQGVNFRFYQTTTVFNSANITYQSSTLANTTGYAWQIGASEVWGFEAHLVVVGVAGGMEFGFNAPTSATVAMKIVGNTSGPTAFTTASVTALNTADTTAFCTASTAISIEITGTVTNSTTPGVATLMWKSVTNTNTSTINAGSYMYPHRIN